AVKLVGARGADEVVAMQTVDLVRPPGDSDLAPLGHQGRVLAEGFGQLAYLVGKGERAGKIIEGKNALQLLHTILFHQLPGRNLALQGGQFRIVDGGCADAAGGAAFLCQPHCDPSVGAAHRRTGSFLCSPGASRANMRRVRSSSVSSRTTPGISMLSARRSSTVFMVSCISAGWRCCTT